jgi:DtxR family Mn-dependent transcriptional regulator
MSERTIEEYLESIDNLEKTDSPVKTSALAQALELSPGSVSEMLQRLSKKGLVEHTPYGGTSLTDEGRQVVLKLTRRHRLWEVFLNRNLGISWVDVYQEACNLEHATSNVIADKLAEFLGYPEVCPHGSPIPYDNRDQQQISEIPLTELETGYAGTVSRVACERDSQCLSYLADLGLTPGATVKVIERAPFDGTMTVETDSSTKAMGPQTASMVMVRLI